MARITDRLAAIKVGSLKAKGLHADGGGLYLRITASGSKNWIYRYTLDGKLRDMGLGPLTSVPLAQARKAAAECRRQRLAGLDPIAARRCERAATKHKADAPTFRQCAEELIASHEIGWKNAKHRQQWRNTLATYAYPILGNLPVADVGTDAVLRVLQQPVPAEKSNSASLWNTRSETASRLRGRIEAVLSWAKARGLRSGENPAQWRGHLDHLLPARSKVRRVRHHPALPYSEMPAFMARLRESDSISARALEFVILTASRTGEALGARFVEIDLEAKLWTVPAERMKAGKEHRVPLSPRAITIVKEMGGIRMSDYLFPGMKQGKPLSDMALLMLLRDLRPGVVTHGFRSTFRDWAAEQTLVPNFVAEAALAHVVADKVEAAYRRADLLEKRRKLMEAWAAYCGRSGAHVVSLRGKTNLSGVRFGQ